MKITYLTIFPELFDSFRSTTLISRAVSNRLLSFETINPRHFCDDKHRIVDDEIYGGGHGLLMKAPPIIAGIKHWIEKHKLTNTPLRHSKLVEQSQVKGDPSISLSLSSGGRNWKIIIPHPSQTVFNQTYAHQRSEYSHLLFICGRYEGIDERVRMRLQQHYPYHCIKVSLGQFVTLGGELPAMTMTESIVRLMPGVINTEMSRKDESYSIEHGMNNIEYAQYTRPEIVEGMKVPDVLLSGNHKKIQERKQSQSKNI